MEKSMNRIPFIFFITGILSPLPLFLMTIFILFYPVSVSIQKLIISFVSYAVILLSFTGGINWILAMQKPILYLQSESEEINKKRMLLAISPCIIGEITIVLTIYKYDLIAIFLLISSYMLLFSYEKKIYLSSELPGGYYSIRWILTIMIEVCLISAFIARLI